jgi:cell wall-associated NlpC family hydrolase
VTGLAVSLCLTAGQPGFAHTKPASPAVTTCAALAAGAQGKAVKTVQKAIGTAADGDFGPATQKAVRKWQKKHSLPVTGVVDGPTWASLPAATAAAACSQQVHGSGVATTCARLAAGVSGLTVVVLQTRLGMTADGKFGSATARAVKQTQQTAGLNVTGVTNANTWKALKLLGTPACSTAHTVGPRPPADEKAQAKVRKKVARLAARLVNEPGTTKNKVALKAMAFARQQIGKPYAWGGTGPKSYDCSGLTMTSYVHAGLTIPRVAAAQYSGAGVPEPLDQAKQGDLLFFASDLTKPSTVYHVSMYVGSGSMLEAPHTGANVRVVPLSTTNLLPVVARPVAGLSLPLKTGDTGWSVTQLQQNLDRHGANLAVDGGFGASTRVAVRAWQHKRQLKTTGVVRMPTWLTF